MKKRGRESSLLGVLLWEDQTSQRMSQLHKVVMAKESRGASGTPEVQDHGVKYPVVLWTTSEQVNAPVYACGSDLDVIHQVELAVCPICPGVA
jgi:hypothetical protein